MKKKKINNKESILNIFDFLVENYFKNSSSIIEHIRENIKQLLLILFKKKHFIPLYF